MPRQKGGFFYQVFKADRSKTSKGYGICAQCRISTVTRIPVAKEPQFAWKVRLVDAACDALFQVLRFGSRLPSEFYGGLQQRILQLLIDWNKSPDLDLVPYSRSPQLRAKVYRLLRVFLLHGHPNCATALHGIVELLKVGLRDPAPEVAEECRECLDACRAIAYPKFPPLETPVLEAYAASKRSLKESDPNEEPAAETSERSAAEGPPAKIPAASKFSSAPPISMQGICGFRCSVSDCNAFYHF